MEVIHVHSHLSDGLACVDEIWHAQLGADFSHCTCVLHESRVGRNPAQGHQTGVRVARQPAHAVGVRASFRQVFRSYDLDA